mmetsp:Transcript_7719/g.14021  ORF Transcript_7719/g.14021 Transcript_7719/m.14021 type:complete len:141 (+) Transcript_7719:208-630(+)
MFLLEKDFSFEAMHVLKYHDGKCSRPHGHSYVCTIQLRSVKINSQGPKTNMLMDFSDISSVVRNMVNNFLDHQNLNETLGTDSPTAEFIAKWIYDYLKPSLQFLSSVTVRETNTSRATYIPESSEECNGHDCSCEKTVST